MRGCTVYIFPSAAGAVDLRANTRVYSCKDVRGRQFTQPYSVLPDMANIACFIELSDYWCLPGCSLLAVTRSFFLLSVSVIMVHVGCAYPRDGVVCALLTMEGASLSNRNCPPCRLMRDI